jgi:Protein of unknown function (DUF3551)
VAATSSLQLRVISNFGTPSTTGITNCEPKTIIEIENGISGLLPALTRPHRERRHAFTQFLLECRGSRLCENGQAGIVAIWSGRAWFPDGKAGIVDIKVRKRGCRAIQAEGQQMTRYLLLSLLMAGPASGQTAIVQYPFCIQGPDNLGWSDCSFNTLQAFQPAASGMSRKGQIGSSRLNSGFDQVESPANRSMNQNAARIPIA